MDTNIKLQKMREWKPFSDSIFYKCPGCGYEHCFSPKVHQFNGDLFNPTVSPSLLLNNPQNYHTCHSFVKNGMIEFLSDCWHHLAGQTVELPGYTAEELSKYREE
jgi:hypothetical protein